MLYSLRYGKVWKDMERYGKAEETEQEALRWQQIALQVTRRLAEGSAGHGGDWQPLLAAMEKPLNRCRNSPPTEDYSAFLEESEMANAARSLVQQLALSERQLQDEEAGMQRLRDQLKLQQEVAAAEAAEDAWQKSRLQSAKQSIAKHLEAIRHQTARAEDASRKQNALQKKKEQLSEEHRAAETEEFEEYQRRCHLETEHQELQQEMLGLCEELASANRLAEIACEEQLQRSHTALRSLETVESSTSNPRPSLPQEPFQGEEFLSTPTFGNRSR
eukprot:s1571_g9.t1